MKTVSVLVNGAQVVKGFLTFMHVDENGKIYPHGVVLDEKNPEEQE